MRLFKKYKQRGVLNMQGKRRGRRCIKKEKGGVGYDWIRKEIFKAKVVFYTIIQRYIF